MLAMVAFAGPDCVLDSDTPAGLYLLTFAPGDSLTSVFGHTALLDWDPRRGDGSRVYDFGHFNSREPGFVKNFLTNQQDYSLGSRRLRTVVKTYERRDRRAIAQRLDLSEPQRRRALGEIVARAKVRDGRFRYHWFSANCTTEVVDVIDVGMQGAFRAQHQELSGTSPRREVLRHSADHPLWFGLHWGSGAASDPEITYDASFFIPQNLMDRARVTQVNGRDLVSSECVLVDGAQGFVTGGPPRRSGWLVGLGVLASLLLAGAGRVHRSLGLAGVLLWGGVTGLLGLAATIVGVGGTFTPFWGHHGLLLAGPLHGLLVPAALHTWWRPHPAWARWLGRLLAGSWVAALLWAVLRGNADFNLDLVVLLMPTVVCGVWLGSYGSKTKR